MRIIVVRLSRNHSAKTRQYLAKKGFAVFEVNKITAEIQGTKPSDDEEEASNEDKVLHLDERWYYYECIYNGNCSLEEFLQIMEKLEEDSSVTAVSYERR